MSHNLRSQSPKTTFTSPCIENIRILYLNLDKYFMSNLLEKPEKGKLPIVILTSQPYKPFITFFFYNTIPVSSFLSKLTKTDNFLLQWCHVISNRHAYMFTKCAVMPFIYPLKVLNRESISIRRQCFYTVQVLIWNLCDNCITTCYIYCTAHCLENLIVIYWDQWVCWDVLVNSCTVEVENYGTVFVYRIAYRLLAVVTLYPTCGLYCMWMVVSFSWFMLIFTRFLKSVANINISVWKYLYIGIFIAFADSHKSDSRVIFTLVDQKRLTLAMTIIILQWSWSTPFHFAKAYYLYMVH